MGLPDDYESTCKRWTSTVAEVQFQCWTALGNALGDRPGWWFNGDWQSAQPPTIAWCYGLDGAARLVITLDGTSYNLYDADNDRDGIRLDLDGLIRWLDAHECEHEGLTGLQTELFGHLLPDHVEKWRTAEDK